MRVIVGYSGPSTSYSRFKFQLPIKDCFVSKFNAKTCGSFFVFKFNVKIPKVSKRGSVFALILTFINVYVVKSKDCGALRFDLAGLISCV